MKQAIIIGAGIGGLATAALLGKHGYRVTVLEKNPTVGGRARVWREQGFTFDMGPSWYLMPDIFARFFALFDHSPADLLRLKHLDPHYRIFFSPAEQYDISADFAKNMRLFEKLEPGVSENIRDYFEKCRIQYEVGINEFVYKNYNSVFDLFNKRLLTDGVTMAVLSNLDTYISQFTTNAKIKKILLYSIVFLGGSPKNTPALYALMSHVDFKLGVYYPMGGMTTIIDALVKLCKAYNVEFVTNAEVTHIDIAKGVATGVKTSKRTYTADIVIANADYPFVETHLLDKQWQSYPSSYWAKKTIAPSAFILYLGVKGRVKNLRHHNLFFAHDWEEQFDEIFQHPAWPDKPSYYVCCPSVTDPSVAPAGCTNIFVLVPVATDLQDSDRDREIYAHKVISHLEDLIDQPLARRIIVQRIFSQRDFTQDYHAYKGTALGLTHTLLQTAIFRPHNRSAKVRNLYYVGQYTLPGIGMPMCLISAQLVTARITKELQE